MPSESNVELLGRIGIADGAAMASAQRVAVFGDLIKVGRENGWIKACRAAVEENAESWLREYTEIDSSQLPWFLKLLHKREINPRDKINSEADAELLITGISIAQSIADAALAALILKKLSQNSLDESRIETLLTSLYRATVRWQPLKAVASVPLTPDPDTVARMRRGLWREHGNLNRQRAILQTLQDQHPAWEIAPIAELIGHFLGLQNDHWERITTVNVPLVRWDKTGFVARLELERRRSEVSEFYRDPFTAAFLQYDTAFRQALDSAWAYVRTEFAVTGWEVRWRLVSIGPDLPNLVTGGSIGAGVAVTLAGLFNGEQSYGSEWAITGTITDEGVIGTVNGHHGALHDDYHEKLDAVAGQHLKLIVPSEDWLHVKDAASSSSIQILKGASTVKEALDIIATDERGEKRRQLFKRLLYVAGAAIFALFLVATVAAGYAWQQRTIAIENGHQLADAKRDLEIKNAQLIRTNDDLSQTVAQLDIARKQLENKNVVLADTNIVLGQQKTFAEHQRQVAEIARNNEQEQRKKAEEQRSLAEIARNQEKEQRRRAEELEKVASAQRQLAVARQAELQADRAIAENDPAAAQVLYAKALTLDERQDTKGRYLQARSKRFMKPSWSSSIGYISTPVTSSFDGDVLAVGRSDSSIAILNAANGQPLKNLVNIHADRIEAVAFSPKDQQLATASSNGLITIWNYKSGEQLRELWFRKCGSEVAQKSDAATKKDDEDEGEEDDCSGDVFVAFNHDGTQLAVATTTDPRVIVLDVKTGNVTATLSAPLIHLTNLTFTPDNKIHVACITGSAWILQAGSTMLSQLNHNAKLLSSAVSSTGLLVTSGDNLIRVWNLATNKQNFNEPLRHNLVTSVDFTPDGQLIVSGASDGTIKFWETGSGKEILNFSSGQSALKNLAFTKDRLVVKSGDQTYQTIRMWQLTLGASAVAIGQQIGITTADVVFSPDGTRIASLVASDERSQELYINIWDAVTRRRVNKISLDKISALRMTFGHEDGTLYLPPVSLHFIGKGEFIALGGVGPELPVFKVETGEQISFLSSSNISEASAFTAVASSSDGRLLAAADDNGRIHVIDIKTGTGLSLEGHEGPVTGLKFSPDSTSLASSGMDSALSIWDLKTRKKIKDLPQCGFAFVSVDYSPDGRMLAATSTDQKIRIWDLVSGVEVLSHETFEPHATSISFSPNGRWLGWSSFSTSEVHLLNIENREEVPPLKGSRGVLMRISFSPDGKWLATAGSESEIRLWNMAEVETVFNSPPGELLKTAEADTGLTIDLNDANSFAGNMPVFSRSELYSTVGLFTESTFPVISKDEQRKRTGCVPVPIVATLNPFPVSFVNPAPACHNFPMLDARIVEGGLYSGNQIVRDLGRTAHVGDTIRVRIYVDNGAANNAPKHHATARNVALTTSVENLGSSQHVIKATVTSDNANALSKTFLIRTNPGSVLEVVPNSGQIRDWQNALIKDGVQLGGNRYSIGDLPPGFETDLFLYFDVRVAASNSGPSTIAITAPLRPMAKEDSSVTALHNKGRGTNCPNPPTTATLNPFRITFSEKGEPCTNYVPLDIGVGDKYSASEEEWNSPRIAKAGDELSVLIYVDNGAANSLPLARTLAKNVTVRTLVDTSVGPEHKVSVSFAGDNTNTVSKVLTIRTAADEFLEIVPDSSALFNAYNHLLYKLPIANRVVSVGDIAPGFETDLFLRFTVRVRRSGAVPVVQPNQPDDSSITRTLNKVSRSCPKPPATATLNPFPLTFKSPPERCLNYPALDLHIGHYSRDEAELYSERNVSVGDEFYALIYIDNGAAENLPLSQTLARNVQVRTAVDSIVGTSHKISVSFAGDNTNTVVRTVTVRTPPNSILEVVPNSGQVLNYQNVLLWDKLQIGNNILPLGDIGPGFDKDLFVRFKIRVKSVDKANTPDPEQSRLDLQFNKRGDRDCPNPPVTATLNPFPITYVTPAEHCKNFQAIDVRFATESGQYSQSEEDWKDGLKATVGDELYVLIYVDNGAANSLPLSATLARNVRVTTRVESETNSLHQLSVSFAGENTNTVAASFPIHTEPGSILEIVPYSGEIRDWLGSTVLKEKLQVGNNTIDIGDIAPGFETDLFIRFKVRVVLQVPGK